MSSKSNEIKLTSIQKLIVKRMQVSKLTKPCYYVNSKADITEFMALRPKLRKSLKVKITTNTLYIHTVALSVKKFPLMIGRIDGEYIKIPNEINVGFAVNAPQGLVVPVIRNADKLNLAETAKIEQGLIEKARDNQLTLEHMEGGTIALSNLGPYGIDSFIAIVPPQTSTIISVGNVVQRIVPHNGKIEKRRIVTLNITVDSRVVNEIYASRFLSFIKEKLENPQSTYNQKDNSKN
ncbi:MAG: 2-oxo acid dehydrogenase subunit E2 [Planctomycetota bacterium]|jgi:pyruvate dehydrogenase E2 component (dihydrolipoamide acetyltransferase)